MAQRCPNVGDVPLISDASSDILSRPIDISRYGLIYAGAQKNLGPAGATIVIIREDLLAALVEVAAHDAQLRHARRERLALQHAAVLSRSTRVGLVLQWLRAQGGLAGNRAGERAQGGEAVRGDRSDRLLRGRLRSKADRSLMNVTFRLPSEELEKQFVKESTAAGLRRPEGPPLRRRHARVDLQRLPRGRRRRARRLHAGVRAEERVNRAGRWRKGRPL